MSRHGKQDRVDVLVTQGWGKSAYNVVRSLGRRGLSVALGTDKFSSMAVHSRYASLSFQHSFPVAQTPEFVGEVRQALTRYGPKVYLPLAEDTYIIAKYIDHLKGAGAAIPIASFQTIRTLHKKDSLARLAESLGIPTPCTVVARSEADIRHFLREFGAPVVLKRVSSSYQRQLGEKAGGLSGTDFDEPVAITPPQRLELAHEHPELFGALDQRIAQTGVGQAADMIAEQPALDGVHRQTGHNRASYAAAKDQEASIDVRQGVRQDASPSGQVINEA